jgi:hypothetical protein
MRLRLLEFTGYSALTDDGKLIIGGIFDTVNATVQP